MLLGALTAVALGVMTPGAGAAQYERACTLIGCSSGVTVVLRDLPRVAERPGTRMMICAAGRCTAATDLRFGVQLDAPIYGSRPVRVLVVLRNAGGKVVWRRERTAAAVASQPNGPGCEPTCWTIRVAVDGAYLRVVKQRSITEV